MRFANKTVLITGAGAGMGREAALRLVQEGATVFGSDIDEGSLAATAELTRRESTAGTFAARRVDITEPDALRSWVDEASHNSGSIDILYNNASFAQFGAIDELTPEQWRDNIEIELNAVFYATQAVWPHMKTRGGVVVNVGSIAGMRGVEYKAQNAHGAAKAGVINLTKQLAVEGAPHGIRVVCVSPGFIHTDATDAAVQNADDDLKNNWDRIPLGRIGKPADVVSAALFLASEEASWITGVNLPVDGGSTILG